MKKIISKINVMLLLALSCLMMPVINSDAADGTMQISDSAAAVGEIANVTVTVEADGAELGDCEATLVYDTELLEFVEGTNAEATDGGVWLAQYGTGTETQFTFELQFRVIGEGSSTITLGDSTAYLYSDETLYLQATGGEISSEESVGVSEETVEMNGTTYNFYEDFSEALILNGFTRDTLEYEGVSHNVITQSLTGRVAAYLVAGENDPVLAIYDEATTSFIPAELVSVSNTYYLILMGNGDGSKLSEDYAETTLEINGTVFPAWQNMNETDYFLVYALSSEGFEGFYQYDSREGTYQRYVKPSSAQAASEGGFDNVILNKLNEIINAHFVYFLAGVIILILVLLIVIMIMSSIIGKRNAELDDLYDELENGGHTDDDEVEYDLEDEYEDEEEYEDEYESEDEYDYDDDETYDYDDEYDFEDEYEEEEDFDFDEEVNQKKKYSLKKRKAVSKDTCDYSVDFIDL